MRIVGGSLRGRRLAAPDGGAVRPTSERAREALFDRLAHGAFSGDGTSSVADARVVDAFCGTGALGLEALSRGAAQAAFLDSDAAAIACVRRNIAALGVAERATVLHADATCPPRAPFAGTLAFLDPPYGAAPTAAALAALAAAGWLAPGALCIAETAAKAPPVTAPADFETLDRRSYGNARFTSLRFAP